LGLKLVTIGELDAHREESPELIGSEAVEDIGEAGEMFRAKELELPLGRVWPCPPRRTKRVTEIVSQCVEDRLGAYKNATVTRR
jgi:hypothetical protein